MPVYREFFYLALPRDQRLWENSLSSDYVWLPFKGLNSRVKKQAAF